MTEQQIFQALQMIDQRLRKLEREEKARHDDLVRGINMILEWLGRLD